MEIKVKFDGDKLLDQKLKTITRTAKGKALREAAMAGAELIVQDAKRRVAVDTGKTKRYIRSWFAERGPESVTVSVGVTAKTREHVARFLEMGTSRMAAKPFLRPAIDEQQRKASAEVNATMVDEVMGEAKKSGR